MEESSVSFLLAFSAGFLSFLSPCVLPLVPSYLSYITGLSLEEMTSEDGRKRARAVAMKNALLFIAGFSTIFILFGLSATAAGRFFLTHQKTIQKIGGVLIVFFGLYVMGVIRPGLLMRDVRFHFQEKPAGLLGSFLVGIAFGAGWTPCVGPILGTILFYASSSESIWVGVRLLLVYSAGLGLPFFLSSLGVQTFLDHSKKSARYLPWLSRATGLFLIIIGVMTFTHSLPRLTSFLSDAGIGWTIGQ
jgi:cytochrome c-type biogenesis protein